jgi:hypothetical protein
MSIPFDLKTGCDTR